jgi:hypothetical protein
MSKVELKITNKNFICFRGSYINLQQIKIISFNDEELIITIDNCAYHYQEVLGMDKNNPYCKKSYQTDKTMLIKAINNLK